MSLLSLRGLTPRLNSLKTALHLSNIVSSREIFTIPTDKKPAALYLTNPHEYNRQKQSHKQGLASCLALFGLTGTVKL